MVMTNKNKFNIKYKQPKDQENSVSDISKLTGIPVQILNEVGKRGVGARKTNPESVRQVSTGKKIGGKSLKGKMSAEQWKMGRIYSFIMKGKGTWGKADSDLADKVRKKKIKGYIR